MSLYDPHTNFAYSTVATAPSPATSGTSLTVTAGQGALFLTPPFNLVVWPTGVQALSTNAEIVRVTGVSTDTFTIVRNTPTENNNSFNRTIAVGDQVAVPVSYKMITDIENNKVEKAGDTMTGDLIGKDFVRTRSGTITRSGGYVSGIALTGGRTLTVTRDASNLISTIADGAHTWTFTRTSGLITSWIVT